MTITASIVPSLAPDDLAAIHEWTAANKRARESYWLEPFAASRKSAESEAVSWMRTGRIDLDEYRELRADIRFTHHA